MHQYEIKYPHGTYIVMVSDESIQQAIEKEKNGEIVKITFPNRNDHFKECYYMESIEQNDTFKEQLEMRIWPTIWGYDGNKDGHVQWVAANDLDYMKHRRSFMRDVALYDLDIYGGSSCIPTKI